MAIRIENDLSVACKSWIDDRIATLEATDLAGDVDGNCALRLYRRIAGFPFERYPNYTAPWHLIMWPHAHIRWQHVFNVVRIIESLRQPTGAHVGDPIRLEPFQIMILLAFLGPENPGTGLREVREGILTLARKNAKTTLVAGLATALMCLHTEDHGLKGQEIQVGASDREQAGITHMMAERFVQLDDVLGIGEKFHSVSSRKTLQNKRTLTTLKCLSSDAYRHLGGNPAIVLLDEIGAVSGAAAEDFYSTLTTGYAAQKEPLTLLLSTQAPTDQHFFAQQVDRCKRINERSLTDTSTAGFIFTVPEQDADGNDIDMFDESAWYLAAPGLGTIASLDDMREWANRARQLPSLSNAFENLKLNRRVSESTAFISRRAWKDTEGEVPNPEDLYDRECYIGLDLSETTDLCAMVLLFEGIDDEPLIAHPYFWIPGGDILGRCHRDKVPYDVWERRGLIDTKSAQTVDYARVAKKIVQCIQDYNVQCMGFDRWKMKHLRKELSALGYEWDKEDGFLIEIGQGFRDQSRSVEVLETLLLNKRIRHPGHPILSWNAANAVIIKDAAGGRKFEKSRSFGRIDGIVALALAAHARDTLGLDSFGGSVYTDNSVEVFM